MYLLIYLCVATALPYLSRPEALVLEYYLQARLVRASLAPVCQCCLWTESRLSPTSHCHTSKARWVGGLAEHEFQKGLSRVLV